MSNYLVFQLYAPLLSWGQAAVGEVRHTGLIPSRSALLGLLAAALGIKREQEQVLNEFNQHYQFAVRPFIDQVNWLVDYHTVQVPRENKKVTYQTRRDELTFDKQALETILSSREYHGDAYYHVALRITDNAPYSLVQIQQALIQPVFQLYLGRKSCPLGLPAAPIIVNGDLAAAFATAEQQLLLADEQSALMTFFRRQQANHYYWQQDDDTDGFLKQQTRLVSDNPLSRKRWQFGNRIEHHGILSEGN